MWKGPVVLRGVGCDDSRHYRHHQGCWGHVGGGDAGCGQVLQWGQGVVLWVWWQHDDVLPYSFPPPPHPHSFIPPHICSYHPLHLFIPPHACSNPTCICTMCSFIPPWLYSIPPERAFRLSLPVNPLDPEIIFKDSFTTLSAKKLCSRNSCKSTRLTLEHGTQYLADCGI